VVEPGTDVSQRVLRAAKRLFFANGFANTSLLQVAGEAGTSESGVLRYYRSKSGLLRAVYASCYADINDQVDEAVAAAASHDPDPRNLLLAVARAVLEGYQAEPEKTSFLLSHFGYSDNRGAGREAPVDPAIEAAMHQEYHRYLDRIRNLCQDVMTSRPRLAAEGVSHMALAEIFTSIVHGIQTSWYMAESEDDPAYPRVSIEDSLATLRFFMYRDGCDK
jgi:AcrR family transcriptional regulator